MAENNSVFLNGDVLQYWREHAPLINTFYNSSNTKNSLTIHRNDLKILTDKEWEMFKAMANKLPQYPGSVYVKNTAENIKRGYSDDPFKQMLAVLGYIPPGQVRRRPRAPLITNGNMGEYDPIRIAQGAATRKKKKRNQKRAALAEERYRRYYRNYNSWNNYNDYRSIPNNGPENVYPFLNENNIDPENEYANLTRNVKLRLKNTQTRRRGRNRLRNRPIDIKRRIRTKIQDRRRTAQMKENRANKVENPEE